MQTYSKNMVLVQQQRILVFLQARIMWIERIYKTKY